MNLQVLKWVYFIAYAPALFFFFSDAAQARWPLVKGAALAADAVIAGMGTVVFFSGWPLWFATKNPKVVQRAFTFGLKSILWAIYGVPLVLLFCGSKDLLNGWFPF